MERNKGNNSRSNRPDISVSFCYWVFSCFLYFAKINTLIEGPRGERSRRRRTNSICFNPKHLLSPPLPPPLSCLLATTKHKDVETRGATITILDLPRPEPSAGRYNCWQNCYECSGQSVPTSSKHAKNTSEHGMNCGLYLDSNHSQSERDKKSLCFEMLRLCVKISQNFVCWTFPLLCIFCWSN